MHSAQPQENVWTQSELVLLALQAPVSAACCLRLSCCCSKAWHMQCRFLRFVSVVLLLQTEAGICIPYTADASLELVLLALQATVSAFTML